MRRMRRIGLLGGMSWESSVEYYRFVNEAVRDRLGGLHSADCVLRSVDFAGVEELQRAGRWDEAGELLAAEARALVAAGAELIVLCTNTMHRVADAVTAAIDVPFVHIADATAEAVRTAGASRVGLLATAYTMEQDFYVGRLRELHGLEVLVPGRDDRRIVHDVIYHELCVGVVDDRSRREYRRIMRELAERGAEAILLGCTEIDLLVGPDDSPVPVFDTTRLHAEKAVEVALEPPGATAPGRAGPSVAERPAQGARSYGNSVSRSKPASVTSTRSSRRTPP
jgi:amino-acid racemase